MWQAIENPTISKLQASCLIIQYRIYTGRFQRAFMLSSIAARSANALRLNYERTDIPMLAQEVRRRLMWSLACLDSFFSIGLAEFELCAFENVYLAMPCTEAVFQRGMTDAEDQTAVDFELQLSKSGLYAAHIRILTMRRDIIRLNRQAFWLSQPVYQLVRVVESLAKSLQEIHSEALKAKGFLASTLDRGNGTTWRKLYVGVYLSWHQCQCDLYRLFLHGYREAAPDTILALIQPAYKIEAARICLQNASKMMEIIYSYNQQLSGDDIADADVAICAYHAARLILFIANTDLDLERPNKDRALSQASMCLAFLRRFFSSAISRPIIGDLQKSIDAHVLGQCEINKDVSSDSDHPRTDQGPTVAVQHQRLGIHSIVQRAHFVDDSGHRPRTDRESGTSSSVSGHAFAAPPPLHGSIFPTAVKANTPFDSSAIQTSSPTTVQPEYQSALSISHVDESLGRFDADQHITMDSLLFPGFYPWMDWQNTLEAQGSAEDTHAGLFG